jgi:hypothetical protein
MPILHPSSMSSAPTQKSVTVPIVADDVAIGIVGAATTMQSVDERTLECGPFRAPRTISIYTKPGGHYFVGKEGMITIVGVDVDDKLVEETFRLASMVGSETVLGSKAFFKVSQIIIPGQPDDSGTFEFGLFDIVMGFRGLRIGGAGAVTYRCALDGSIDTIEAIDNETLHVAGTLLSGRTTATKISLYA